MTEPADPLETALAALADARHALLALMEGPDTSEVWCEARSARTDLATIESRLTAARALDWEPVRACVCPPAHNGRRCDGGPTCPGPTP